VLHGGEERMSFMIIISIRNATMTMKPNALDCIVAFLRYGKNIIPVCC
jgi:hypothetical protein